MCILAYTLRTPPNAFVRSTFAEGRAVGSVFRRANLRVSDLLSWRRRSLVQISVQKLSIIWP
jgi:hypothetical protein